ncbi:MULTISPECIES: substrate-binding domain-containing protein [Burkholderia]|uniref:Substrate-binding domain-containing protein n=1 Tax=Burkholderia theae TaxID=3143496 RepID=A0ABU9WFH3_9BURK|nr:substrate-binding domain-containing protein [Burkholderia sp. Z1]
MVQVNQQALFFTQMNAGAQAAARSAGADLIVFNSNNDPVAQNNAIETYVQQRVDAILVAAIDVNGIKPAIREARRAGIPVVAIDAIVNGDNDVQVGVDNRKVAEDIGRFTASYIAARLGGGAQIGVLGAFNSYVQNLRVDGFKAGLAGEPKAKVVAAVDGQNVQDRAQAAGENLIAGSPNLQLIYATGEPALIGALAALGAQDTGDRVKIVGWDLSAQAVKGLDDGSVIAVVQQDPEGEGRAAVDAALRLIQHKPVNRLIAVPATIVTKTNLDKFRVAYR